MNFELCRPIIYRPNELFQFFCSLHLPWSLTSGKNFMIIHQVVLRAALPSPHYLQAYVKTFTCKPDPDPDQL